MYTTTTISRPRPILERPSSLDWTNDDGLTRRRTAVDSLSLLVSSPQYGTLWQNHQKNFRHILITVEYFNIYLSRGMDAMLIRVRRNMEKKIGNQCALCHEQSSFVQSTFKLKPSTKCTISGWDFYLYLLSTNDTPCPSEPLQCPKAS